jgi:hypothetical protein
VDRALSGNSPRHFSRSSVLVKTQYKARHAAALIVLCVRQT